MCTEHILSFWYNNFPVQRVDGNNLVDNNRLFCNTNIYISTIYGCVHFGQRVFFSRIQKEYLCIVEMSDTRQKLCQ